MTNVPASWRKATYSAQETDCVEVNQTLTAVRDSKNPAVHLTVDVRQFVSLLGHERVDS